MSKKDKINKQIEILKYWLSVFVLSEFGLISWLVSNYNKKHFLFFVGVCLVFLVLGAIITIQQKINKKIDKLEDL